MGLWVRTLHVTGHPDDVARATDGHRQQLRERHAAGKLHLAGELAKGDGYMDVLDVADRHEAERLTADNPLVAMGLAAWTLREWSPIDPGDDG